MNGLIDSERKCHLNTTTNETFWKELQQMSHESKLPADEYFQYVPFRPDINEWKLNQTALLLHYSHRILNISSGIHDIGSVNWELALCLLLAWVCVFLVLLRGIKSFGKVNQIHSKDLIFSAVPITNLNFFRRSTSRLYSLTSS